MPGAPEAPSASPSVSTSASATESAKDLAREHFARGIALFAEESWDAALSEFQQSRALYPTRNATKNAALCLRQLHRFDEALDMFETLLHEFPDMPPEARAVVDKEMRDLRTLVGRIDVKSGVGGASILIDSRPRGTVPSAPIRVSVGTHVVRVIADGYLPFEAQVQVASGETAVVDAQMRQLEQAGFLRIAEATGQAADVIVDGVVVGKAPWEGKLPVGAHAVALDGPGNLGVPPVKVMVSHGQSTPLTLTLETLDARLRIEPNPSVATVALDRVVLGRGLWEGKVKSGAHRIELAADGYLPTTKDITIPSGRSVIPITLERDPQASLTFREAQAARLAWIARRGFTPSFELRGQGILLISSSVPTLRGTVTTGTTSTGPFTSKNLSPVDDFGGGGTGGIGARVALLYMALPDPSVGRLWSGFHVGSGIDVNFGDWWTTGTIPVSSTTNGETTTTKYETGVWSTAWMFNVPLVVGYQLGIGSFSGHGWTGAVIGLAYAPSYSILMPSKAEHTSGFRWASFEATIDFLDKPMKSKEKIAHGRFFVYGLLPTKAGEMVIMNFGGGAVWY
ncbi:MAG: PEGA domain-containing protein [Polyangiales bacterium]